MPIGWHTPGHGSRPVRSPTSTRSSISRPITLLKVSSIGRRAGSEVDTLVTRPIRRQPASTGEQRWVRAHGRATTRSPRSCSATRSASTRADFDGIAALFAQARITNEGVDGAIVGADAVRKLYQRTNRVHDDGTTRTRHVNATCSSTSTKTPAAASARSSFVVFQQTAALPLQPIVSGRYRDTFVRTGERVALRLPAHHRRPRRRRPRAPHLRPVELRRRALTADGRRCRDC